eukprot:c19942_g1_i1 orf=119-397(+)
MAAAQKIVKRIPLIKFPVRRPVPSRALDSAGVSGTVMAFAKESEAPAFHYDRSSDVSASPRNSISGGRASIQPKRTPITEKEIEAILLGGIL